MTNKAVLQAIRRRRVARRMTAQPIARTDLETVLAAARHAPSAGNRRLQRFVVIDDPTLIRLLRMVSPGMIQRPAAIVLICIDWQRTDRFGMPRRNRGVYVDVGAAMQTILLAAEAVGLGAGPVTSFSRAAVAELLNLPEYVSPELFLCLGYRAADDLGPLRRREKLSWRDLTQWGRLD